MFDITVYEKDGKRHIYDHVSQITNIADNVVIDFILDFNGRGVKTFDKDQIEYIKVTVMKGVN